MEKDGPESGSASATLARKLDENMHKKRKSHYLAQTLVCAIAQILLCAMLVTDFSNEEDELYGKLT